MTARLAVLSDVHGNVVALEAVRKAIRKEKPDARDRRRRPRAQRPRSGRRRRRPARDGGRRRDDRPGQHRHRGRRLRLRGRVPVDDRRRPGHLPRRRRVGPRRARRRAARLAAPAAVGAAAARRRHDGPRLPRLARLADGRASTRQLDPNVVIERVARTDARVIACGHTHLPEVRDLGWKLIVNDGSAGYVFDGDPTASWALIDIDGGDGHAPRSGAPSSTRSPSPTRSPPAACRATSIARPRSAPGSSSDERDLAGRAAARRRDRDGPGHRPRQRRRDDLGRPGRRALRRRGRSRRSIRRG